MAERCYLAVDLGAESGRVVAGLFDGKQVRLEDLHRFSNGAVNIGGTLRWDVLRLWSDIQNGLTNAASKFGAAIASVGVDTWGVDYVLMTKTNEMLGAPWHYRDARSKGMLNHAFTKVPRGDIFAAASFAQGFAVPWKNTASAVRCANKFSWALAPDKRITQ